MGDMSLTLPVLETDRLRLRPFTSADGDDLFALHSDAYALRYWDSPPWTERSRADLFVTRSRELAADGTCVRLVIRQRSDDGFVGWITLNDWNPDFRSAALGYCLARAAWGQGYATEAARALLTWAYDRLDLNRVKAEADTRNDASARVLTKLGFVLEGTQREDCVVDGVVSDTWVFGLLRREWEA